MRILLAVCLCSSAYAADNLQRVVEVINSNKATYLKVQEATGLDYRLVAALHYRECGSRFNRSIQDGRVLPKDIDWVDHASKFINKWRAGARLKVPQTREAMLEFAERWNGLGYRKLGVPSPYVWSGTDRYVKGKFTADGSYDSEVVDKQIGVAPILDAL